MGSSQQPLPEKEDVTRALLLKGTVFIHLDPRDDTVVVPGWLKEQPQLVLQIGLEMPIPIPDLRVDGDGVFGTLSFNRRPFTCTVPWERVFAVVGDDGRGMVWPDSMPQEIAAEVDRGAERRAPSARARTGSNGKGRRAAKDEARPSSRPPMPLRTDDELPDGAFRMRPRSEDDADADAKSARPDITAIDGEGQGRARPSNRPPGEKLKLPPYMRVVK